MPADPNRPPTPAAGSSPEASQEAPTSSPDATGSTQAALTPPRPPTPEDEIKAALGVSTDAQTDAQPGSHNAAATIEAASKAGAEAASKALSAPSSTPSHVLFDAHFQRCFVAHMLQDTAFLAQVAPSIKADMFIDDMSRLVHAIKSHFDEHKWAPGGLITAILAELKTSGLIRSEVHASVTSLANDLLRIPLQNGAYLLSQADSFVRYLAFERNLPDVVEAVQKRQWDKAKEFLEPIVNYASTQNTKCKWKWEWVQDFDKRVFNTSYIVNDILMPDQPFMIFGLEKTMKSTNMYDLGLSIATGTPFLNRFAVLRQMPVAIVSYESGPRATQDTLRRIAAFKGLSFATVQQSLAILQVLPKIDSLEDLSQIRLFLKETGAGVLLMDNIYLCMTGDDWSNASKIANKLMDVKKVCDEFGCLLGYTHHNRKTLPNPHTPTNIRDCTGAGFSEFAGQWLGLSRQSEYMNDGVHPLYLSAGGREDSGNLYIPTITEGRKTDPGGRHYKVCWDNSATTPEQVHEAIAQKKEFEKLKKNGWKISEAMAKSKEKLKESGEIMTNRQLRDETKLRGYFDAALEQAVSAGVVIRYEKDSKRCIRNGRAEVGFGLTNPD